MRFLLNAMDAEFFVKDTEESFTCILTFLLTRVLYAYSAKNSASIAFKIFSSAAEFK